MRPGTRPGHRTAAALALWTLLVAGSVGVGVLLGDIGVGAPPLAGSLDPRAGLLLLPAVAVGCAVVAFGSVLAARLGRRTLLVSSAVVAALWALALALADGPEAIIAPPANRWDYLVNLPLPTDFLSTFVDRLPDYTVHAEGHPPGLLLLLSGLHRVGLGGTVPATALYVAGGASAVPATLIAVGEVAGERRARTLAPVLVLAPAAVWIATSADALYLGVGAWSVALGVLAVERHGRKGDLLAGAAGLLFGLLLFGSYGAVLLAPIAVAWAVRRRRVRPVLVAGVAVGLVAAGFAAAGFWWLDGLLATLDRYGVGISSERPYAYFVVGNLGAFALAAGPASAAGLASLRGRGLRVLAGTALAVVLLADLSGLSKGEVERIWLPFVPWVLAAAAEIPDRWVRPCLAAQAAAALGIQVLVRSPW